MIIKIFNNANEVLLEGTLQMEETIYDYGGRIRKAMWIYEVEDDN